MIIEIALGIVLGVFALIAIWFVILTAPKFFRDHDKQLKAASNWTGKFIVVALGLPLLVGFMALIGTGLRKTYLDLFIDFGIFENKKVYRCEMYAPWAGKNLLYPSEWRLEITETHISDCSNKFGQCETSPIVASGQCQLGEDGRVMDSNADCAELENGKFYKFSDRLPNMFYAVFAPDEDRGFHTCPSNHLK